MQANTNISQSVPTQRAAGGSIDYPTWNKVSQNTVLPNENYESQVSFEEQGSFSIRDYVFLLFAIRKTYVSRSDRQKAFYAIVKRGLDLLISLTLVLLTIPLFLFIAFLIKITSRDSIFFKHRRLGQGGKLFWCYKFRTMYSDAEERLSKSPELQRQFEESFKIQNDPRITPLGALLRKTSLDELPQLFQVIRGEMSLVGPRPIVERELSKYSFYGNKLLSVKPGLSGLWQISGRSEVAYPERVLMDMHYIDYRCIMLDLQLILLTPLAVFRGHGAC